VSSGGIESSSMWLCGGHDEILIRFDLTRKLVAQHLDDVESGKQAVSVAQGEAPLSQEAVRDQDQCHMVTSGEAASDLILRHAASAVGVLELPVAEVAPHQQVLMRKRSHA